MHIFASWSIKIATERATEWTNNALPKDGGVKDTDVYVDLKHTNADSGGITFVNRKSGVAYLTLHGKNAGVKGFPRIPANLDKNEVAAGRAQVQDTGKLVPINRSAAEVNALDDLSVKRSTFSNPLRSADHIPDLYPDLGPQADKLINDFGYSKLKVVSI